MKDAGSCISNQLKPKGKSMGELIKRLAGHPFVTFELILASFFANLLGLASTLYIIQLLNRYVSHGVDATLLTLTVGVTIAVLFEFAFRRIRTKLAAQVGEKRNTDLMMGTFSVLTKGKMQALATLPPKVRQEIMKGVNTVEDAYKPAHLTALFDVPFSFLFVGVLFTISVSLGCITLIFMLLTLFLAMGSRSLLQPDISELTEISIAGNGIFTAVNLAPDTVRLFDRANFLMDRWRENTRHFLKQRKGVADGLDLLQNLTKGLQSLLSIAIYAVGAMLAVQGELNVGILVGANILAMRALAPITRFSQLGDAFTRASQAMERLAQFGTTPSERDGGVALKQYRGGITLRDISFRFPGMMQPLFESLSLALKPGSILVVTGDNGSGKTTLARLISGLLEPERGQILVDGVDLRQIDPGWWRSNLTLLPQQTAFLPGTIRENIKAANPGIDNARLNTIIHQAGLAPLIDQTPQGLDTPITMDAGQLSAGDRKRVALARALSVNGKLLIWDEPTEGLDPKGCSTIYGLLRSFAQNGYTLIVFSQDPKILKGAIRILDLNVKPVPRLYSATPQTHAAPQTNAAPRRNAAPQTKRTPNS